MKNLKLPISLFLLTISYTSIYTQSLFIDSGQQLGETSAWSVSLQDIDGDNDLDVCIDGQIWTNNGNGIFTASELSFGSNPTSFSDFNSDNYVDAVCGKEIFFNDRNGNFVRQDQTFGENVYSTRLLDLDNDDDLDAITCTSDSDEIWFNDGDGNFTNNGRSFGGWSQCKYESCDINNDGFTDIVMAFPHTPPPSMNDNINDIIWLGDGNGNYTKTELQSVNFQTRTLIPADFDSDGDLDLFMGKGYSITGGNNGCKILFNDGKGNFTDSGQQLNYGYNSSDANIKDLDNDGDLDIFVANGMPTDNGQPNTVWLNDGSGNFSDSGLKLGNSNSVALALGDLDNDGDVDAICANVNINTGEEHTGFYTNTTNSTTGIKTGKIERETFQLNQNYPNPFNPSTNIEYSIDKPSPVQVSIYNILGQKIKTLVNSFQNAGEYSVVWNATDSENEPVSTGIYFYNLTTGSKTMNKKMILLR
ncbi:MAG: T9SS type A sorting domain-containing protein [Ignavibacteria bacterium]